MKGHKVIGFCAMNNSGRRIFCRNKTHLAVLSSEQAVRDIAESNDFNAEKTKKVKFSNILDFLRLDKINCLFDKTSYSRFYPLALEEGIKNLPVLDEDVEFYEIHAI